MTPKEALEREKPDTITGENNWKPENGEDSGGGFSFQIAVMSVEGRTK